MQTGYCLGAINSGGYIRAVVPEGSGWGVYNGERMVHRESIFPWPGQEIHSTLADAKKAFSPDKKGNLILEVANGAGVQAIWCSEGQEALVKERLKTWNGCYGAWAVKLLRSEGESK